ncbi:MAG: A/G-specific adenine glycosylase [Parcubacteria bacterium C7867-002]|nr:MAG: A/G-specific adenine glycosylase [Parcubacteria bacterium C7867-002]
MPWRTKTTSYYVVVSEIMLQQTQVTRVMDKFTSFIKQFPSWQTLAQASTHDVLKEWSGLGYNRRALYLKRIAEQITEHGTKKGILPSTYEELCKLPGIGPNTAGSILAFAFNIPYPFIETNIRSVFIHFFFGNTTEKIHDRDIRALVEKTLDTHNPREWYYALMDYGVHLKNTQVNPSRKSAHHTRQTPFKGSNRELRSRILKHILKKPINTQQVITSFPTVPTEHITKNLIALEKEGFIIHKEKTGLYHIA